MFRIAPFALILDAYCFYHIYTNKMPWYWYMLVFSFPFFGACFYLVYHNLNRSNINKVTEGFNSVMNSNNEIEQLEKYIKYNGTIKNKARLSGLYAGLNRYDESIELFISCLEGFNKNHIDIIRKLVYVYHLSNNFEGAIEYGDRIKDNMEFVNSEEYLSYAWSFYELKKMDLAKEKFDKMDARFSNYPQRMEYGRFLHKIGETDAGLEKLEELMDEYDQMESFEQRQKKSINRTILQLYREIKN